jgi:hypothetical protein
VRVLSVRVRADRADRAVSSGMNFLAAISRERKSPRDAAFPVQRLFE